MTGVRDVGEGLRALPTRATEHRPTQFRVPSGRTQPRASAVEDWPDHSPLSAAPSDQQPTARPVPHGRQLAMRADEAMMMTVSWKRT